MRGITKIKAAFATLLVAVGAFVAINAFDQSSQASAAGCSSNSVVRCGVWSVSEMRSKYNSDYTKGTKTIYGHLGVTSDMVNKYRVVEGTGHRDGTIKVGNRTVATNAYTAGRNYIAGSTKHTVSGTTFYTRSTQVSFVSYERWPAYVFLNEYGQFVGGVIKDCGNPIQGKNVVPKPTFACKSLTATTVDRLTRKFYVTATAANGAKVTKHVYNFGDGQTRTVTTTSLTGNVTHKYAQPGTYTATVDVYFTVGTTKKKSTCTVKITVAPEPKVKRCDLKTGSIVEVTETEAKDPRYTEDLAQCDDVKVCDPATGDIITVKKSEASKYEPVDSDKCKVKVCDLTTGTIVMIDKKDQDNERYTTDLTKCDDVKVCDPETGDIITVKKSEEDKYLPVDSDECKIKVCDLETGEVIKVAKEDAGKENYTTDLTKCDDVKVCDPETGEVITVKKSEEDKYLDVNDPACKPAEPEEPKQPEKPVVEGVATELPETGAFSVFNSVLGLGSLTAATYYYLASRRQ